MMNQATAMEERRTQIPVFTTEELFRTFLVQELKEDGYDAEVIDVTRPTATSYRGVRIGISSVLSTTVNIKSLYEEVRKGNISFAEAYDRFLEIYEKSKKKCVMPDFDFRDYEEAKEHLIPVVVAKKAIADLTNVPHKDVCDLSIVYKLFTAEDASTTVTDQLLEIMGVSAETIHADAIGNLAKKEIHATGLDAVFGGTSAGNVPLVVSIEEEKAMFGCALYGAAVIFHPDFVSRIRKEIGEEEFYILPSSKHEVIVMPAHLVTDPMHLVAMVKEVNASSVDEDDRLTDNAYFCNKEGEMSAVK
jgi:hypothetical protein